MCKIENLVFIFCVKIHVCGTLIIGDNFVNFFTRAKM